MTFITINTLYAFLLGTLPPLLWLWFWLKEDTLHPEPKKTIILCFLLGMVVVPVVLPIEKFVNDFSLGVTISFILWAGIEEIFKFIAAYIAGIRTREDDEPIDAIIYLISVALGFAAIENLLFLLSAFGSSDITGALITGSMRFVGSTLLHTVASSTIGIFIAFSFYRKKAYKIVFTFVGLFFATFLHAIFNVSIVEYGDTSIFIVFFSLWLSVVVILLIFEKIKSLKRKIRTP